jgi:hypothetical protein
MSRTSASDRGCVKTHDDCFVSAKDRDLVDRGSILSEFIEHDSSESKFCEFSFLFLHSLDLQQIIRTFTNSAMHYERLAEGLSLD